MESRRRAGPGARTKRAGCGRDGHDDAHGAGGLPRQVLTPDQTTIQFEVNALDESALHAVRAGDRTLRIIAWRLRVSRVSEDQLHTQRVSLRQEYDWTEQGRVSLGFRYSQSLTLQVDGTDRAGQLIDRIVSAGGDAVSINSVSFSASGRAEAERDVLLAAMSDARATADAMAAQIGKEIFDTIEVTVASALSPVTFAQEEEAEYASDLGGRNCALHPTRGRPGAGLGRDEVRGALTPRQPHADLARRTSRHPPTPQVSCQLLRRHSDSG